MKRLDLITLFIISLAAVLSLILLTFESFFSMELPRSTFLLQLTALVTLGWWIWGDASRHRIPFGLGSAIAFLGCFPVFFIFYCFRSRGRQGWRLCLAGTGALLVYLVLAASLTILVPEM